MRTLHHVVRAFALPALLLGGLVACERPLAMGEANSILVVTPDSVWQEIEDEARVALEPTTVTVRDERVFNVTQVAPTDPRFERLQVMRQIVVIGEPGDPWVQAALEEADGPVPTPPAVLRVGNVWARGQQVTVMLLPPGYEPADAKALFAEVGERILSEYTRYAQRRMYVSGVDSAVIDSLRETAGFTVAVPRVYRVRNPGENAVVLVNDQPDPSELIRSLLVSWRPSGEVEMEPEAALRWRAEAEERYVEPPQVTNPELTSAQRFEHEGRPALQIQGLWANPPGEWPAAGPFITWMVECPEQNRTYLLDAWLYAPGKDKYEFMVQLRTLLESFRCGAPAA